MTKTRQHLIDCDKDPFIPKGWSVEEHQKDGQMKLDMRKVGFSPTVRQKVHQVLCGAEFLLKLKNKKVLNANVLDYLLKHPELIPKSWKDKKYAAIFFWGTVYRDSSGLCVRCLYYCSGWHWSHHYLHDLWFQSNPVAVRAG